MSKRNEQKASRCAERDKPRDKQKKFLVTGSTGGFCSIKQLLSNFRPVLDYKKPRIGINAIQRLVQMRIGSNVYRVSGRIESPYVMVRKKRRDKTRCVKTSFYARTAIYDGFNVPRGGLRRRLWKISTIFGRSPVFCTHMFKSGSEEQVFCDLEILKCLNKDVSLFL